MTTPRATRRRRSAADRSGTGRNRAKAASHRSRTEPAFEAFWLAFKPAGAARQLAVAKELASSLGLRAPRITWLGNAPTRGDHARQLLLTPSARQVLTPAQAWEGTRVLRRSPALSDAEPLFATPGVEPDPARIATLLAPHERRPARKSGGSTTILPCAASNPLWHLEAIAAPEAWLLAPPAGGRRFGEGIVVGHPDTGYTRHFEIWDEPGTARRLQPQLGYDFEAGRADPADPLTGAHAGHGTATASVIMSSPGGPGTVAVTGSAPKATLVPIRVSDSVIHFSFRNATQAIYHAVDHAGAHVISMSLGGPLHSSAFEAAIAYALANGVIVMAAAGNVWPFVVYPARFANVIAVAATNCASAPWRDSAHGKAVDIAAPGESVWRARSTGTAAAPTYAVAPSSGTSYAVATLAGACATWLAFHGRAALLQRYGAARLAGVFARLVASAGCTRPAKWNPDAYGAGILDLRKLLDAPLPPAGKAAKAPRSEPRDPAVRIAGYFPDVPAPLVARGVKRVLGTPRGAVGRKSAGALLGDELAFHVATNATLRAELRRRWLALAKKGGAHKPSATLLPLLRSPSPTLAARLAADTL
jgi:hypothetical protein